MDSNSCVIPYSDGTREVLPEGMANGRIRTSRILRLESTRLEIWGSKTTVSKLSPRNPGYAFVNNLGEHPSTKHPPLGYLRSQVVYPWLRRGVGNVPFLEFGHFTDLKTL